MHFFKRKFNLLFAFSVVFSSLLFASALYLFLNSSNQRSSSATIKNVIYSDDFSLNLSPIESSWLKDNPVIRLGIDRAFPPFGYITKDNKYAGFSADYMRMIEYRLGLKFDIAKDTPWKQTLEKAKAGDLDMISALVNTKERQQYLNFTDPFVVTPTIIISNVMKNGYIGSIKKLKGKKVAVEAGSYVESELTRNNSEITLISVKNTSAALGLVSSGGADAYIGNAVTANTVITKLAYSNLSFSGKTEYSSDHSIGINKSNSILAGIISKALASITKPERDVIASYWFGMNTQPFITKKTAFTIGIVMALLLAYLGSWSYCLRRSRNKLQITQKEFEAQSEIDFLTGLGNRNKFYKTLERSIQKSNDGAVPFALLFLDLDRFKEINDSLGHAIGDLLLCEAARRISMCIGSYGAVSRIGGDEFMIILANTDGVAVIEKYAECIKNRLNDVFIIDGNEVNITTSIGVTRYPMDADNAEQLVINGDQAMYYSKKKGRNCYSFFRAAMQEEAIYKTNLIKDLRVAVEQESFSLNYQPIVDLSTNSIHKAEALIRWNHSERGFVSPAEFIPLAEESGLINTIGEWVFKTAMNHTLNIQNHFGRHFQMSINTSPLQYDKNGISISAWNNHLQSRGLSGKNIVVEITEGVLMETHDTARKKLFKIRDLDIDVAIDDFGTGYSSLSYLKMFDIDYLKIDQSFVRNLTEGSDDDALVQAIIIMAHKLGIKVIAEGIETKAQKDILIKAGCDFGQGYYFSKPVGEEEFITMLEQWNNKSNESLAIECAPK